MTNPNPATPAQAATPGNGAAGSATPSSTTPANVTPTGQGNNPEGTVAIPLKEYRDLQRAKARTLSFDKRAALKNPSTSQPANGDDGADSELVNKLAQEREGRQNAERRALQAEVRGRVNDLLSKPEYKDIAPSTKSLILKNPAMLSSADNIEEAMLDIEDFVQEHVTLDLNLRGGNQPAKPNQPSGHETPPTTNGGNPAPAGNPSLEDVSNLSGPARSRAVIRNALKKAKGVK